MKKIQFLLGRVLFLLLIIMLVPFKYGLTCSEMYIGMQNGAKVSVRDFNCLEGKGFIRFSPVGMTKKSQYKSDNAAELYSWSSKYASLTFNEYFDKQGPEKGSAFYIVGIDGLNTKGLKVGSYLLESSFFAVPEKEAALDVGSFAQYILDNFQSVEEVVKDIKNHKYVVTALPTNAGVIKLHFYLHDLSGDSAIIEFLSGKVNVIRNPKISAITNLPYKQSLSVLEKYRAFGGSDEMPDGNDPPSRFIRSACYLKNLSHNKNIGNVIALGFSIEEFSPVSSCLANDDTWWTIVTDVKNGCVYFKTGRNSNIAFINFKKLALRAKVASDVDLLRTDLTGDISKMFSTDAGFTLATVPKTPNYNDKVAWAKLPSTTNMKTVDVFFVHPTTYFFPNSWNESIEFGQKNPKIALSIKGQASVFDKYCNVYVPHYRDAHIKALDANEKSKTAALKIAYGDVESAFAYYLKYYNNNRPFILAGHSQGSELILWLLQNKFKNNPQLQHKLIASYIIGWSITAEDLKNYPYLKISSSPEEIGAIVTYNTEGKNPTKSIVQKGAIGVNPLTMDMTTTFVPRQKHLGAVFLAGETMVEIPHFTSAQTIKGALFINVPQNFAYISTPFKGFYHSYDYSIFYRNLEKNVSERINAYFSQRE